MNRREKIECLLEIQEAIEYFQAKIDNAEYEIDSFVGQFREMRDRYTDDIDTYKRCINRLNERFSKQLLTLK